MGKKMTKAGMVLRRAVRADFDANPKIDHLVLRRNHGVPQGIVESALAKTLAEWDALIAATPEDIVAVPPAKPATSVKDPSAAEADVPASPAMPGLEQGYVKFTRKPAKMGADYIFWVPRVYLKNGIVDPHVEYEVYLKKRPSS